MKSLLSLVLLTGLLVAANVQESSADVAPTQMSIDQALDAQPDFVFVVEAPSFDNDVFVMEANSFAFVPFQAVDNFVNIPFYGQVCHIGADMPCLGYASKSKSLNIASKTYRFRAKQRLQGYSHYAPPQLNQTTTLKILYS